MTLRTLRLAGSAEGGWSAGHYEAALAVGLGPAQAALAVRALRALQEPPLFTPSIHTFIHTCE